MKRSLKILVMIAIFAVVTLSAVPSMAQFAFSGGVSVTEMTPQSGIFSHIDALRDKRVVGSWFSTAGILPIIVKAKNLEYVAYGDFPGISNIQKVFLTPDSGKTQWPATQIEGRGWCTPIPMFTQSITIKSDQKQKKINGRTENVLLEESITLRGLSVGGYGLEWAVLSKDKQNRWIWIFIPITYTSTRTSSVANHIMVQSAPAGFDELSNQQVFAYLRGFVPSWATPDPAVIASQNMAATMPNMPLTQPQCQVDVVPQLEEQIKPVRRPQQIEEPILEDVETIPQIDGTVSTYSDYSSSANDVRITVWKGEQRKVWSSRIDLACLKTGDVIEFRNGAKVICVAEVIKIGRNTLELNAFKGSWPTKGCEVYNTAEEAR